MSKKMPLSLLSDAPAEPGQDKLDYRTYCKAMVSLIKGLPSDAPFTMSIFGSWGSGKTTLLRMIKSELDKQKMRSIWVSVWKVGNDEDVWKAFLQALLVSVKEELPWHKKWMFHLGLMNRRMDWVEIAKRLSVLIVKVAIVITPLYVSFADPLAPSAKNTSNIAAGVITTTGTIAGAILGWFLLLQPYLQEVNQRVKVDLQGLVKDAPLRKRVTLLEEFNSLFETMVKSFISKKEKLTIFIDDLDRCPPERMVQVLDSIKLFLDLPNCVYLMGMDREVVEQAIALKFANYKDPAIKAREYLEKIITLPFDLPPLSPGKIQDLVEGLKTNLTEECTRVFALGQEPNPRKVKLTINLFILLWELANKRKELAGKIKPVRLAKLIVIQHSYRDLYRLLNDHLQCLKELETHYRESKNDLAGLQKNFKEILPDYLQAFTNNRNLSLLLTLYPSDDENSDRNFIDISEEDMREYIMLTRSVSRLNSNSYKHPLIESMKGADGRKTFGSIDDYWTDYKSDLSDPYTGSGAGSAEPL